MIRALVAVEPDLSSSIALRYTCQLANKFEMEIQAIHAHEPAVDSHMVHVGWARRTWEKTQLEESKKEIEQLLTAEGQFCPVSIKPIIVAGDAQKEILERLGEGKYDLYVEGIRRPLSEKYIEKKIQSSLYQTAPCPILLVQNLVPVDKVLLVFRNRPLAKALRSIFCGIFRGGDWAVDVLLPRFQDGGMTRDEAEELIGEMDCKVREILEAESISDMQRLTEYGLVAVPVNRGKRDKSHLVELVKQIPTAILFCWL